MISPRRSLVTYFPQLSKLYHFHTIYSDTTINRIIQLLLLDIDNYYYPGPPRSKYCPQSLPANTICTRKHTWITGAF